MSPPKKRVAVIGAAGFTGKECLRLLEGHPCVELAAVMSARDEERPPVALRGALHEAPLAPLDLSALEGLDAVFLATPHERAAQLAPALVERVSCTIDLSAAHRLKDLSAYPRYYGFEHPHPALVEKAIFGLSEQAPALAQAAQQLAGTGEAGAPGQRMGVLLANPGCYVTSVCLPLLPLIREGMVDLEGDLILDCKSGVSGAGKNPGPGTHFASVHEDFRAYGIGTHRHEPEIRETLGTERAFFVPHLLPVFRGILSSIHLRPAAGLGVGDLREKLRQSYAKSAFVQVLAEDEGAPCLSEVQGTNLCRIAVLPHGERCVIVSVLDNLIKGAAGQAVQNFNLLMGLEESAGLPRGSALPMLEGWR
ncbi:MAG TPA: N-acetyl-gamma-glutamyl-phosphate reductase [Planctomycetes bacterium]|nr:N-acetyl-gamma-glutamyl-phosphate reductase [Planctomycetota bacterium]